RITAYAATSTKRLSQLSGRLSRLTATVMGVTASTSAAISPAVFPNTRLTPKYNTTTDAIPAIAPGSRIEKLEKPNAFAKPLAIQRATGGLSTVMKPAGSYDAKKKLCQLCVMLRTAAA